MSPKYLIIDTETGGLVENEPSLLSLYAYLTDSKLNYLDDIELKIKPDDEVYRINPYALAVNKINLVEHNKIAITESEAKNKFLNFVKKNNTHGEKIIPVGHNLNFDLYFTKKLCHDWEKYFSYRVLDTASVAKFLFLAGKITLPENNRGGSLEDLANYFKLDYTQAHDAKFDVQLTLNVLKKLLNLIEN